MEMERRYPLRRDSPHPAVVAIRTGEPVVTPEMTDELMRAICHDEEHHRLAGALGLRTMLSVPLIARGQTLRVLSLASVAAGRRYGPADLELAQDLARRAAVATDNARLYQASQEDVRLRKRSKVNSFQAQKMEPIGRGSVVGHSESRPSARPTSAARAVRKVAADDEQTSPGSDREAPMLFAFR